MFAPCPHYIRLRPEAAWLAFNAPKQVVEVIEALLATALKHFMISLYIVVMLRFDHLIAKLAVHVWTRWILLRQ